MSDSLKDRLKTDLETIKTEGGTRTNRIREIIQTAAAQTLTELKEGATELRSTASQSVSSISETLNASESSTSLFDSLQSRFMVQLLKLDTTLASRYGDRYSTIKQRFGLFQTWYNNTKANAEIVGITPVEQKQSEIELKVADQGSVVARKEQQIRQQVKELLNAAISKR
ncbi:hypothetical protein IQ250_00145 [Pseudanabaenaceae cyanobacterium LEGE 13415]|nr:hypothetical protein [Pseudanabaenaceae cyanobacterium LEGE 13415]